MPPKAPKKEDKSNTQREVVAIPFDEALRRMVNAPPQHKSTKKPSPKKG
jgi:hypothetical protein